MRTRKLVGLAAASAGWLLLNGGIALAAVVTNAKLDGALQNALDTIQYYGPMIGGASTAGGYLYGHFAAAGESKDKADKWVRNSLWAVAGTAIAPSVVDLITGLFK